MSSEIFKSAKFEFRYGYYTELLRPGFRIVAINSNFCNDENFWILTANGDPGHQHRWLIETLQHAEARFQNAKHFCDSAI